MANAIEASAKRTAHDTITADIKAKKATLDELRRSRTMDPIVVAKAEALYSLPT